MTYIAWEKHDGLAVVTLRRPERLNALSPDVTSDLCSVFEALEADGAGIVVLTASGRHFCAGGDFDSMQRGTVRKMSRDLDPFQRLVRILTARKALLIAAVQGASVGAGLGLVLLADLVVAAPDARFGTGFARVGLVPDTGLLYTLPRRIGVNRAKELFLSNRMLSADEALAWGIVNRVVSEGDVATAALELAREIAAASPPHAIEFGRRLLDQAADATLEQALALEQLGQTLCRQMDDHYEAVQAYQERRTPRFAES